MKTISIRLNDDIYERLSIMLEAMGQTKQTFFEAYTRTALRERSIPFIIKAPIIETQQISNSKLEAFSRLEELRTSNSENLNYDTEREAAMNAKYGTID